MRSPVLRPFGGAAAPPVVAGFIYQDDKRKIRYVLPWMRSVPPFDSTHGRVQKNRPVGARKVRRRSVRQAGVI